MHTLLQIRSNMLARDVFTCKDSDPHIRSNVPLLQSCACDDPTALGNLIKLPFRVGQDLNVFVSSSGTEEWSKLSIFSSWHIGRRKNVPCVCQTAPQRMDEALLCGHPLITISHLLAVEYSTEREYFLLSWFWPSEWLTRILEGCYRQVLQVCPLWKTSLPSSVTLSGAMWAAIHFCLPLPAVQLLFLSVGRLLPPIHLCEAAARPRPLSWTDGKQSEWSCVQGGSFPS